MTKAWFSWIVTLYILRSVVCQSNDTAAKTASQRLEDAEVPIAMITIAVLAFCIILGLLIAKGVDYCHDKRAIRDDASDISDFTKDLLKVQFVYAFNKKLLTKIKNKETVKQRARRMGRIWATQARRNIHKKRMEQGGYTDRSEPEQWTGRSGSGAPISQATARDVVLVTSEEEMNEPNNNPPKVLSFPDPDDDTDTDTDDSVEAIVAAAVHSPQSMDTQGGVDNQAYNNKDDALNSGEDKTDEKPDPKGGKKQGVTPSKPGGTSKHNTSKSSGKTKPSTTSKPAPKTTTYKPGAKPPKLTNMKPANSSQSSTSPVNQNSKNKNNDSKSLSRQKTKSSLNDRPQSNQSTKTAQSKSSNGQSSSQDKTKDGAGSRPNTAQTSKSATPTKSVTEKTPPQSGSKRNSPLSTNIQIESPRQESQLTVPEDDSPGKYLDLEGSSDEAFRTRSPMHDDFIKYRGDSDDLMIPVKGSTDKPASYTLEKETGGSDCSSRDDYDFLTDKAKEDSPKTPDRDSAKGSSVGSAPKSRTPSAKASPTGKTIDSTYL